MDFNCVLMVTEWDLNGDLMFFFFFFGIISYESYHLFFA